MLQKSKERYHNYGCKEKAAKCYIDNKKVLKENANNKYKDLSEDEKKTIKREYARNRYKNMKEIKQVKKC